MASDSKPLINLLRGWPAPALLPTAQLQASSNAVLSDPTISIPALQYGPDSGFPPLREELAKWLSHVFSVTPDPDRICITGGASQNLANVLQSFSDPKYTRSVWLAAPCYFLACPIFEDAGFAGRLKAVPEDHEGVDVEYLARGLEAADKHSDDDEMPFKNPSQRKLYRHIIYVVPTSANPSGKTLPLSRRRALVALARAHNALIIADDVYDLLQWHTTPPVLDQPQTPHALLSDLLLPRLCDIDLAMGPSPDDPGHFGYAMSNGSFSKIAGPGCRTGWVEASPAFVHGVSQTGSTRSGGAPSQLCAAFLWDMLRSGTLQNHLEQTTVPALQRRHALLSAAVREHLYPLGVTMLETSRPDKNVYGGYFVWLTLDSKYPARAVAERAREQENLILGYGDLFEVYGDKTAADFGDKIRLCFSWEPEHVLVDGVKRFAHVLSTWDSHSESSTNAKSMGDWR
ncbi:hypothetical protein TD95_003007 [Thielaviopsis punctulata]|uniref:Aminotransferase class I/classII large domain-containing protein n=1 Tax=Thielaviopsis punctulata TaxID=72032 RepID=A0A0F4ZDX6_9PEZI|nr:hypothetical protein TD95_003007 [Thielaviopsis punctulata]